MAVSTASSWRNQSGVVGSNCGAATAAPFGVSPFVCGSAGIAAGLLAVGDFAGCLIRSCSTLESRKQVPCTGRPRASAILRADMPSRFISMARASSSSVQGSPARDGMGAGSGSLAAAGAVGLSALISGEARPGTSSISTGATAAPFGVSAFVCGSAGIAAGLLAAGDFAVCLFHSLSKLLSLK